MLKVHSGIIPVILLLLLPAISVSGQTPEKAVTAEMRQTANRYYVGAEWEKAARAYGAIVRSEGGNIGARYRYGAALLNLGKIKEAIRELETVMKAAPNASFALALARAYAAGNRRKKSYGALRDAVELGDLQARSISGAREFNPFREEEEFKRIVNQLDLAANPCKANSAFREFDFWIGEWDVRNPRGIVVGTSSITLGLHDCVIFENYSASSYAGKSFNIYDRTDKVWHQTWVDVNGTLTEYTGGIQNGRMVYLAEEMRNGKQVVLKMTFSRLPNGSVRQFGEISADGGKSWNTRYDLTYTRKAKTAGRGDREP